MKFQNQSEFPKIKKLTSQKEELVLNVIFVLTVLKIQYSTKKIKCVVSSVK